LNPSTASAFYVNPVRSDNTQTLSLAYNTSTREIVTTTAIGGTLLSNGTAPSDYIYWSGSAWVVGSTKVRLGSNAGATNQGNRAIAIGNGAGSSNEGDNSIAIGYNSAAGNSSTGVTSAIAIGDGASAVWFAAIAMGTGTTASANYSTAVGPGAKATKDGSSAFGMLSNATGTNSVSIGYSANSSGISSVSIGDSSRASGATGSVAMGYNTAATGQSSVAIGYGSTGYLLNSIAIGNKASSNGISSTAIGPSANTTGDYGVAIGINCGAANSSIAIGTNAYLGTAGSITLNASVNPTTANQAGFFVNPIRAADLSASDGRVLVYEPTSSSEIRRTNVLYIGSDAFGGVQLGASTNPLVVNANATGALVIASFRRNTVVKATIDINGAYGSASDIKLKENINLLPDALEKVCQLQPKTFNWKSDTNKKLTTGFIAQDVELILPDLVSELVEDDKSITKSLHMTGLVPYLVSAVKSLNNKVTTLESELAEIKRTLASLVPPAKA
jgi:hypothetical protein